MNKELYEEVTGKEWLTEEELDTKRKEMMGKGLDELDEEWMNLLRFSYQMHQFDVLNSVEELGATTTIVLLYFDEDEVDNPDLEDEELMEELEKHNDELGKLARLIRKDDSLMLDGAGKAARRDGQMVMQVWT